MKKIFEIEWDKDNATHAVYLDIIEPFLRMLKVKELPQPTEYCGCKEPDEVFARDEFKQGYIQCQKCLKVVIGKPKPKLEKLNPVSWYREDWEKVLWNKLNDVIEWINKETPNEQRP